MDNVTVAIHQPNFIPWIGFFHKMLSCDKFVLLDNVQYSKNSFQNRNKIRTKQGELLLTIPVLTTGRYGQQTDEVLIDNKLNWREKHIKTLITTYAKAPYYKTYIQEIESIYLVKYERLLDICVDFIQVIKGWLGSEVQIIHSSSLGATGDRTSRLLNLTIAAGGNTYLSGSSGRKYLCENVFKTENITLKYQDFVHPEYLQFQGDTFISNLSILDLFFNCGQDSKHIVINS